MDLVIKLRRQSSRTQTDWVANEVPGERGQRCPVGKDARGKADGSRGLGEEWRIRNSDSGYFPPSLEQH